MLVLQKKRMFRYKLLIFIALGLFGACAPTTQMQNVPTRTLPAQYEAVGKDSTNMAQINWRVYFDDALLVSFVDTALRNNLDLLSLLQKIEATATEIQVAEGARMPVVTSNVATGMRRFGRYTMDGVGNYDTRFSPNITRNQIIPEHLPELFVGIQATWEVDIWKKLKNRKQTAVLRYLSSKEGRNVMVANLVAHIANYYYDLLALDFELDAIQKNIVLQERALAIVLVQKEAGIANELAVKQFQAQTLNFQTLEFELKQQIVEIENKMNYLMGRYAQPIARNKSAFSKAIPAIVQNGLPTQLLQNRPDIKQAELELQASKIDVSIARADFLPSLHLGASLGLQSFRPERIFLPASLAYSVLGGLAAPLINKNAIKARYKFAQARQVESIYQYQKTMLVAYFEAYNETIRLQNLQKMYDLKGREVETLRLATESANDLFATGRANYLEVVFTQKNALHSQLELIILRKRQYNAMIDLYKALGGGWR